MDEKSELTKAFTTAIGMEKRGYEFYMKAAKKSTNAFGRKVFEALAEDENRHIEAIQGYCLNIAKKDATPALCTVMPPHKGIKERMIFGRRETEHLKGVKSSTNELKAYEIAMEMENDGYDFYKKALEATQDQNAKELYTFLLGEEKAHFELISDTYEYLKDPAGWFIKAEKPIVEG
jgi:rubrerythrin